MAAPPAKKQKINNDEVKSPIVFHTPGFKPDVRLMVFDREFQVHSVLLKLHSAFFRKFLDSPDKISINDVASKSTVSGGGNLTPGKHTTFHTHLQLGFGRRASDEGIPLSLTTNLSLSNFFLILRLDSHRCSLCDNQFTTQWISIRMGHQSWWRWKVVSGRAQCKGIMASSKISKISRNILTQWILRINLSISTDSTATKLMNARPLKNCFVRFTIDRTTSILLRN